MTKKSSIRVHIEKNIDLYRKQNIEYYNNLSNSFVKGIIFRLQNPNLKVLDNYLLYRRYENKQHLFSKLIDKNMDLIENFSNKVMPFKYIIAVPLTLYLIIFIIPLILILIFYYYFIRLFAVLANGLQNKKNAGIRGMIKKLKNTD